MEGATGEFTDVLNQALYDLNEVMGATMQGNFEKISNFSKVKGTDSPFAENVRAGLVIYNMQITALESDALFALTDTRSGGPLDRAQRARRQAKGHLKLDPESGGLI